MVFLLKKAAAAALIAAGLTIGTISYFAQEANRQRMLTEGGNNYGDYNNNNNGNPSRSRNFFSSMRMRTPCNCQVITKCPNLNNGQGIRGRFCGFEGFQRKVCCDGDDSTPLTDIQIQEAQAQADLAKYYRNPNLYKNEGLNSADTGQGQVSSFPETNSNTRTSLSPMDILSYEFATERSASDKAVTPESPQQTSTLPEISQTTFNPVGPDEEFSIQTTSKPDDKEKGSRRLLTSLDDLFPDYYSTSVESGVGNEYEKSFEVGSQDYDSGSSSSIKDNLSILAQYFPDYFDQVLKNLRDNSTDDSLKNGEINTTTNMPSSSLDIDSGEVVVNNDNDHKGLGTEASVPSLSGTVPSLKDLGDNETDADLVVGTTNAAKVDSVLVVTTTLGTVVNEEMNLTMVSTEASNRDLSELEGSTSVRSDSVTTVTSATEQGIETEETTLRSRLKPENVIETTDRPESSPDTDIIEDITKAIKPETLDLKDQGLESTTLPATSSPSARSDLEESSKTTLKSEFSDIDQVPKEESPTLPKLSIQAASDTSTTSEFGEMVTTTAFPEKPDILEIGNVESTTTVSGSVANLPSMMGAIKTDNKAESTTSAREDMDVVSTESSTLQDRMLSDFTESSVSSMIKENIVTTMSTSTDVEKLDLESTTLPGLTSPRAVEELQKTTTEFIELGNSNFEQDLSTSFPITSPKPKDDDSESTTTSFDSLDVDSKEKESTTLPASFKDSSEGSKSDQLPVTTTLHTFSSEESTSNPSVSSTESKVSDKVEMTTDPDNFDINLEDMTTTTASVLKSELSTASESKERSDSETTTLRIFGSNSKDSVQTTTELGESSTENPIQSFNLEQNLTTKSDTDLQVEATTLPSSSSDLKSLISTIASKISEFIGTTISPETLTDSKDTTSDSTSIDDKSEQFTSTIKSKTDEPILATSNSNSPIMLESGDTKTTTESSTTFSSGLEAEEKATESSRSLEFEASTTESSSIVSMSSTGSPTSRSLSPEDLVVTTGSPDNPNLDVGTTESLPGSGFESTSATASKPEDSVTSTSVPLRSESEAGTTESTSIIPGPSTEPPAVIISALPDDSVETTTRGGTIDLEVGTTESISSLPGTSSQSSTEGPVVTTGISGKGDFEESTKESISTLAISTPDSVLSKGPQTENSILTTTVPSSITESSTVFTPESFTEAVRSESSDIPALNQKAITEQPLEELDIDIRIGAVSTTQKMDETTITVSIIDEPEVTSRPYETSNLIRGETSSVPSETLRPTVTSEMLPTSTDTDQTTSVVSEKTTLPTSDLGIRESKSSPSVPSEASEQSESTTATTLNRLAESVTDATTMTLANPTTLLTAIDSDSSTVKIENVETTTELPQVNSQTPENILDSVMSTTTNAAEKSESFSTTVKSELSSIETTEQPNYFKNTLKDATTQIPTNLDEDMTSTQPADLITINTDKVDEASPNASGDKNVEDKLKSELSSEATTLTDASVITTLPFAETTLSTPEDTTVSNQKSYSTTAFSVKTEGTTYQPNAESETVKSDSFTETMDSVTSTRKSATDASEIQSFTSTTEISDRDASTQRFDSTTLTPLKDEAPITTGQAQMVNETFISVSEDILGEKTTKEPLPSDLKLDEDMSTSTLSSSETRSTTLQSLQDLESDIMITSTDKPVSETSVGDKSGEDETTTRASVLIDKSSTIMSDTDNPETVSTTLRSIIEDGITTMKIVINSILGNTEHEGKSDKLEVTTTDYMKIPTLRTTDKDVADAASETTTNLPKLSDVDKFGVSTLSETITTMENSVDLTTVSGTEGPDVVSASTTVQPLSDATSQVGYDVSTGKTIGTTYRSLTGIKDLQTVEEETTSNPRETTTGKGTDASDSFNGEIQTEGRKAFSEDESQSSTLVPTEIEMQDVKSGSGSGRSYDLSLGNLERTTTKVVDPNNGESSTTVNTPDIGVTQESISFITPSGKAVEVEELSTTIRSDGGSDLELTDRTTTVKSIGVDSDETTSTVKSKTEGESLLAGETTTAKSNIIETESELMDKITTAPSILQDDKDEVSTTVKSDASSEPDLMRSTMTVIASDYDEPSTTSNSDAGSDLGPEVKRIETTTTRMTGLDADAEQVSTTTTFRSASETKTQKILEEPSILSTPEPVSMKDQSSEISDGFSTTEAGMKRSDDFSSESSETGTTSETSKRLTDENVKSTTSSYPDITTDYSKMISNAELNSDKMTTPVPIEKDIETTTLSLSVQGMISTVLNMIQSTIDTETTPESVAYSSTLESGAKSSTLGTTEMPNVVTRIDSSTIATTTEILDGISQLSETTTVNALDLKDMSGSISTINSIPETEITTRGSKIDFTTPGRISISPEGISNDQEMNSEIETSTVASTSNPEIETSTVTSTSNPEIETSTVTSTSNPEIETSTVTSTSNPEIETSTFTSTSNPDTEKATGDPTKILDKDYLEESFQAEIGDTTSEIPLKMDEGLSKSIETSLEGVTTIRSATDPMTEKIFHKEVGTTTTVLPTTSTQVISTTFSPTTTSTSVNMDESTLNSNKLEDFTEKSEITSTTMSSPSVTLDLENSTLNEISMEVGLKQFVLNITEIFSNKTKKAGGVSKVNYSNVDSEEYSGENEPFEDYMVTDGGFDPEVTSSTLDPISFINSFMHSEKTTTVYPMEKSESTTIDEGLTLGTTIEPEFASLSPKGSMNKGDVLPETLQETRTMGFQEGRLDSTTLIPELQSTIKEESILTSSTTSSENLRDIEGSTSVRPVPEAETTVSHNIVTEGLAEIEQTTTNKPEVVNDIKLSTEESYLVDATTTELPSASNDTSTLESVTSTEQREEVTTTRSSEVLDPDVIPTEKSPEQIQRSFEISTTVSEDPSLTSEDTTTKASRMILDGDQRSTERNFETTQPQPQLIVGGDSTTISNSEPSTLSSDGDSSTTKSSTRTLEGDQERTTLKSQDLILEEESTTVSPQSTSGGDFTTTAISDLSTTSLEGDSSTTKSSIMTLEERDQGRTTLKSQDFILEGDSTTEKSQITSERQPTTVKSLFSSAEEDATTTLSSVFSSEKSSVSKLDKDSTTTTMSLDLTTQEDSNPFTTTFSSLSVNNIQSRNFVVSNSDDGSTTTQRSQDISNAEIKTGSETTSTPYDLIGSTTLQAQQYPENSTPEDFTLLLQKEIEIADSTTLSYKTESTTVSLPAEDSTQSSPENIINSTRLYESDPKEVTTLSILSDITTEQNSSERAAAGEESTTIESKIITSTSSDFDVSTTTVQPIRPEITTQFNTLQELEDDISTKNGESIKQFIMTTNAPENESEVDLTSTQYSNSEISSTLPASSEATTLTPSATPESIDISTTQKTEGASEDTTNSFNNERIPSTLSSVSVLEDASTTLRLFKEDTDVTSTEASAVDKLSEITSTQIPSSDADTTAPAFVSDRDRSMSNEALRISKTLDQVEGTTNKGSGSDTEIGMTSTIQPQLNVELSSEISINDTTIETYLENSDKTRTDKPMLIEVSETSGASTEIPKDNDYFQDISTMMPIIDLTSVPYLKDATTTMPSKLSSETETTTVDSEALESSTVKPTEQTIERRQDDIDVTDSSSLNPHLFDESRISAPVTTESAVLLNGKERRTTTALPATLEVDSTSTIPNLITDFDEVVNLTEKSSESATKTYNLILETDPSTTSASISQLDTTTQEAVTSSRNNDNVTQEHVQTTTLKSIPYETVTTESSPDMITESNISSNTSPTSIEGIDSTTSSQDLNSTATSSVEKSDKNINSPKDFSETSTSNVVSFADEEITTNPSTRASAPDTNNLKGVTEAFETTSSPQGYEDMSTSTLESVTFSDEIDLPAWVTTSSSFMTTTEPSSATEEVITSVSRVISRPKGNYADSQSTTPPGSSGESLMKDKTSTEITHSVRKEPEKDKTVIELVRQLSKVKTKITQSVHTEQNLLSSVPTTEVPVSTSQSFMEIPEETTPELGTTVMPTYDLLEGNATAGGLTESGIMSLVKDNQTDLGNGEFLKVDETTSRTKVNLTLGNVETMNETGWETTTDNSLKLEESSDIREKEHRGQGEGVSVSTISKNNETFKGVGKTTEGPGMSSIDEAFDIIHTTENWMEENVTNVSQNNKTFERVGKTIEGAGMSSIDEAFGIIHTTQSGMEVFENETKVFDVSPTLATVTESSSKLLDQVNASDSSEIASLGEGVTELSIEPAEDNNNTTPESIFNVDDSIFVEASTINPERNSESYETTPINDFQFSETTSEVSRVTPEKSLNTESSTSPSQSASNYSIHLVEDSSSTTTINNVPATKNASYGVDAELSSQNADDTNFVEASTINPERNSESYESTPINDFQSSETISEVSPVTPENSLNTESSTSPSQSASNYSIHLVEDSSSTTTINNVPATENASYGTELHSQNSDDDINFVEASTINPERNSESYESTPINDFQFSETTSEVSPVTPENSLNTEPSIAPSQSASNYSITMKEHISSPVPENNFETKNASYGTEVSSQNSSETDSFITEPSIEFGQFSTDNSSESSSLPPEDLMDFHTESIVPEGSTNAPEHPLEILQTSSEVESTTSSFTPRISQGTERISTTSGPDTSTISKNLEIYETTSSALTPENDTDISEFTTENAFSPTTENGTDKFKFTSEDNNQYLSYNSSSEISQRDQKDIKVFQSTTNVPETSEATQTHTFNTLGTTLQPPEEITKSNFTDASSDSQIPSSLPQIIKIITQAPSSPHEPERIPASESQLQPDNTSLLKLFHELFASIGSVTSNLVNSNDDNNSTQKSHNNHAAAQSHNHARTNDRRKLILEISGPDVNDRGNFSKSLEPSTPTPSDMSATTPKQPELLVNIKIGPGPGPTPDARQLFPHEAALIEAQLQNQISNVVNQLLLTTHENYRLLPSFIECASATRRGRRKTRVLNFDTDNYPWMARIGYQERGGITFSCAGTIISRRYILTSAYCANKKSGAVTEILLESAKHLSNPAELNYKYKVEKVIPHPEYDPKSRINDLALIRVNSDIQFNASSEIRPICLPFEDGYGIWDSIPKPGDLAYLGGWGFEQKDKTKKFQDLYQSSVRVWPNENCTKAFEGDKDKVITPSQLCAYASPSSDACRGDAGAPLMAVMTRHKIFFQIGVVSHGPQCGYRVPRVYTRISEYLRWILDTMET